MTMVTIPPPPWTDVLQTEIYHEILNTYLERTLDLLPGNAVHSVHFANLEKKYHFDKKRLHLENIAPTAIQEPNRDWLYVAYRLKTGKCPHSGWHLHCWMCEFSSVPDEDRYNPKLPDECRNTPCELLDIAFVEEVSSVIGK